MKRWLINIISIVVASIFLCSCAVNQENIETTEIAVIVTEEDKELSRNTVENFMEAVCKLDISSANKYVSEAREISDVQGMDIDELKQNMLNSIRGTPLDNYRMYELIDKMFSQWSYEILNSYEEEDKCVYDVQVNLFHINKMAQEFPNAFNDNVLEEVIADCLYKGIVTEADLYSDNLPNYKQQAIETALVDKVIEILNEKSQRYFLNASVKLVLIKENGIWLIERSLSDMDNFFEMIS